MDDHKVNFATITYDLENIDYSTKDTFHNTINLDKITNIHDKSFKETIHKIFIKND